ncbi:TPA: hypothetical protein HA244_05720 [Candidatus Micrarchaeota archaeon]|nr:hypothetical protein [Candidatus Micrarchaeota archaeon]
MLRVEGLPGRVVFLKPGKKGKLVVSVTQTHAVKPSQEELREGQKRLARIKAIEQRERIVGWLNLSENERQEWKTLQMQLGTLAKATKTIRMTRTMSIEASRVKQAETRDATRETSQIERDAASTAAKIENIFKANIKSGWRRKIKAKRALRQIRALGINVSSLKAAQERRLNLLRRFARK